MNKVVQNGEIDIRDAFFEEIYKMGQKDKNVVFITDDLDSFVMRKYKKDFPKQFINIGVAEQNLMDVAAGLAVSGKKVFTYGICTYITMRCYEQIRYAICSMKLPVVIIGVGAGFSFGYDGSTHHGTCDVGIMRLIPEVSILNPSTAFSAAGCAKFAYKSKLPVYVRLDKGIFPEFYKKNFKCDTGFSVIKKPKDIVIISTGFMTQKAVGAASRFNNVGVVDIYRLKPISELLFPDVLSKVKTVLTLEENSLVGGLGSAISDIILDNNWSGRIRLKRLGVQDKQFISYGKRDWFHRLNSLDMNSLIKIISTYAQSS